MAQLKAYGQALIKTHLTVTKIVDGDGLIIQNMFNQEEEEIRLLNLLKQANISISYPIKDNENNDIQSLNAPEGERFGVLFSYANGQKQHILSIETHFKIGELMGRFHNATNNLTLERVTYNSQIILKDSLEQISFL